MKLALCLAVLGTLLTSTYVHANAVDLCKENTSTGFVGSQTCLDNTNGANSQVFDTLNYCLKIKDVDANLDSVKTRDTRKQVVGGMLYTSKITFDNNDDGVEQSCDVAVFSQVWMGTSMCTVSCNGQAIGDAVNIYKQTNEEAKKKLKVDSRSNDDLLGSSSSSGEVVLGKMMVGAPEDEKRNIIKRSVDVMRKDEVDADVKAIFNEFIVKYNRTYRESDNSFTYQEKLNVFAKNLDIVRQLNQLEKGSAVYGITKFMDYSADEYKKYLAPGFTDSVTSISQAELSALNLNDIPENVDWREKGAVTDVKNQGMCGSCWAFSTTGNVEGQYAIKHGKLLSLSEQELVDCDTLDAGCNGGLPSNAYKSIETLGGLEAETDYPYDGKDDTCNLNKSEVKVTVSGGVQLPEDEGLLAAWVAQNGPVSIGINANLMQFYWGGVSHPWKIFCNPNKLDHGVLIVGYGTDEKKGTPYWLIKNSWGPDWGEAGYYRIYRGDGSCGVNLMATSAVVD